MSHEGAVTSSSRSDPYDYALRLLAARGYSTRNMRRKLMQREFAASEVDAVIDRLTASGLLDDERFASEYARQKLTSGGSSVRRVTQDLARKGIRADVARAALDRVQDQEEIDIATSIDAAAKKKLLSLGSLDDAVKRRRLFAFLARRGFELEDIKRTIANHFPSR